MDSKDLYASNDTCISKSYKNDNFSKLPYLLVGEGVVEEFIKDANIAFMEFNLESIDIALNIEKAELFLYTNSEYFNEDYVWFPLQVYIVEQDYNKELITWQSGIKIRWTKCQKVINKTHCNGYINIDIKPIVKEWIFNGKLSHCGLALIGKDSPNIIKFSSSRGEHRPFLRLTFNTCDLLEYREEPNQVITTSPYNYKENNKNNIPLVDIPQEIVLSNEVSIVNSIEGEKSHIGKDIYYVEESILKLEEKIEEVEEEIERNKIIEEDIIPKAQGYIEEVIEDNISEVIEDNILEEIKLSDSENFAQFIGKGIQSLTCCALIPLQSIVIEGKNINQDKSSTNINIGENHSYFVSYTISVIPGTIKFEVGANLLLNSIKVPGGEVRTSFNNNAEEIFLSTSIIFNTGSGNNTIQLQYFSDTGTTDILKIISLNVIELK